MKKVSRRDFLRGAGALALGSLAGRSAADEPAAQVALHALETYERKAVQDEVTTMIDSLGGFEGRVKSGDKVAIKVNLTGGAYPWWSDFEPETETYVTHPEVVRAVAEAALDAGAGEVAIVEAIYNEESWTKWGYADLADDLGLKLIDLNYPAPYLNHKRTPVPGGGHIYDALIFNRVLNEADFFISVPKLKCHYLCGITLSMKNLVGLVPAVYYRLSKKHSHRSGLHGQPDQISYRLPHVIVDLNRTRPVDFALIDGIKSSEGGEGPWIKGLSPVEPGVLLAGFDPVAADAVGTSVMGFDPAREYPRPPFHRAHNHIALAAEAGLGTADLDAIEVLGEAVADVRYYFKRP